MKKSSARDRVFLNANKNKDPDAIFNLVNNRDYNHRQFRNRNLRRETRPVQTRRERERLQAA